MHRRATCSQHSPGRSSHGGRYAADAVSRGAVAVLTDAAGVAHMGGATSACRCWCIPTPRSVLGELAATVYGHPSDRLRVIGVTGTSGKTTTTYLVGGRPSVGGSGGRADRHRRRPHRRTRSAQRVDHTRGARSAGAAGGDGRAGGRHRGDGGLQPRADTRPRRRREVRGRRIHQPVARPSGLPPDDGGLLRGQGAAVRRWIPNSRKPFGDLCRRRCGTCHGRAVRITR